MPVKETLIYEHFFIFGCDWYIAEYDRQDLFYGYAILLNDYVNAEWGYVSYSELKSINIRGVEVDRELYWKVKKTGEIEKMVKRGGAR